MSSWMESAWMTQLGWILLHSVWQFALVAFSIGVLSRCVRHSAAVQHALACCGLMMIPAFPNRWSCIWSVLPAALAFGGRSNCGWSTGTSARWLPDGFDRSSFCRSPLRPRCPLRKSSCCLPMSWRIYDGMTAGSTRCRSLLKRSFSITRRFGGCLAKRYIGQPTGLTRHDRHPGRHGCRGRTWHRKLL